MKNDHKRTSENAATAPHMRPLRISHGTLSCQSFSKSRPLYEEFLGLECVQHEERAMLLTVDRQFVIVCIEVGDRSKGVDVLRHWGLDVDSREKVDRMHQLALENKEHYGIRKILNVTDQHGAYSFYFEDRDGNWWEIQYVVGLDHIQLFTRGDFTRS
jgi:predicted lactoylglutathione lyase